MKSDQGVVAKAADPDSRADAIVVSFRSEWYEALRHRRFTSVIRKRVPTRNKPRWLYFHINNPMSAICARADIVAVETIDRAKALSMAKELALSEKEIRDYLGQRETVGCYGLGTIQFPAKEVSARELAVRMQYHAPQSFFVLSKDGKLLLDELCRWGGVEPRGS